jgi:TP53 regulating kinase and related kinases
LGELNFTPVLGAEARIDLVEWYGKPAIRKYRIPKSYRLEQLDRLLRSRRTKEEVEILYASKIAGVNCPTVFFADPVSSEIIMEYIQGPLLNISKNRNSIFAQIGRFAAMLHSKGIIHGDLTTKNVIISGEKPVLIDFGLSFFSDRIEDRAEDLHLLKQALKSTGPLKKAKSEFEAALKGYEEISGSKMVKTIRLQIAKIELRGRYAQVD